MRGNNEKNIQPKQDQTQTSSRISCENGYKRRTSSISPKKTERQTRPERLNFSFTKNHRLIKKTDFLKLKRIGKRFTTPSCRLTYLFSNTPAPKLGLTVTKKYGKAHERNLFKRWIREIFRRNKTKLPKGIEINIAPGLKSVPITFKEIELDVQKFIQMLWSRSTKNK